MGRLGIDGLFYFMASATVLLAGVAWMRIRAKAAPERVERPFEIMDPLTAPISQEPEGTETDGSPRPMPA